MPTRRATVLVIFAILAALLIPAMRQSITPDELDLRTIKNKQRIAQLEMELASLRADLKDLRENCCNDANPAPPAPKPKTPSVHDPAAIPPHAAGAYYFRLTAITEIEKDNSLLEQAKALEKTAKEYRNRVARRSDKHGLKLNDSEARRLLKDAIDFENDAKKIRREYNNPGFALSGFDADGRDVTANVTGQTANAASRIPHDSIVRARGDVIENTDDRLTLVSARVGRVADQD